MLAAALGSLALALLAFAGDKSVFVKNSLVFYKPTGALSGVTTVAIVLWLMTWGALEWQWGKRTVAMGRVSTVSLLLLIISLLLTCPAIVDFL